MYPTAMSYVGVRVPHHILKRAHRRSLGKKTNPERDERLWRTADVWVAKTLAQEDLSQEDLPEEFSMNDLLKAVEDIHGREIAGDVYDFVEMDEKTEDQCEWVLNETRERGFHTTNYHEWVMEAYEAVCAEFADDTQGGTNEEKKGLVEDEVDEVDDDRDDSGSESESEDSEDSDSEEEYVDDEEESHFGVADVTNFVEDREQGPTHICLTVWSQAEELGKKARGHTFTSCTYKEMSEAVQANTVKVHALLDRLGISEEEHPRVLETFTGASA